MSNTTSIKREMKDQDLEKVSFLSNGRMLYFEEDKQFVFAKKLTTPNLKEKVAYLQKMGKRVKIFPLEVHVAILRKNVTIENIGKYYKEDIMRLKGNSKDFMQKYFMQPINMRRTKTKGVMKTKDILVDTYITYTGTRGNMTVFSL